MSDYLHNLIRMLFVIFVTISVSQAHESGDWLVRIGPALIEPNDDSNDVEGIAGSGVRVDNNVTLGFTIGYMVTNNVGVELLGVTPSNHDLNGKGVIGPLGKIGDVDVFPPTLSLQYHFMPQGKIQPYVGVGVNYTHFYGADASGSLETALGGNTDVDIDDSWGLAGQVGVDVMLNDSWLVNAGIWYVDIDADATLSTGAVDRDVNIDIDPWVFFVGIGKRF